jgi:hypothetical protein
VQVGVDDLVGAGLETVDGPDGDVLLQHGQHALELTLEGVDGAGALGGHAGGHVVNDADELLGLGDEVSLATQLDNGGHLAVTHDGDGTLSGFAVGPLGGRGEALDAKPLGGLFHVAVVGLEGLLGVENADARRLTQGLYILRGERHRDLLQ